MKGPGVAAACDWGHIIGDASPPPLSLSPSTYSSPLSVLILLLLLRQEVDNRVGPFGHVPPVAAAPFSLDIFPSREGSLRHAGAGAHTEEGTDGVVSKRSSSTQGNNQTFTR